jgi:hypothetical protein
MQPTQYAATGYGSVERIVGDAKNSGRIHVPKNWIGKRALVILLEPITDPSVPLPPSSE